MNKLIIMDIFELEDAYDSHNKKTFAQFFCENIGIPYVRQNLFGKHYTDQEMLEWLEKWYCLPKAYVVLPKNKDTIWNGTLTEDFRIIPEEEYEY